MITPRFTVHQDDTFVTVVIHAPHIRAQDVDIHVEGCQLRFYARPYFLRLTFPKPIVEDDRSTASYDLGQGDLRLQIAKMCPGEHFPDLDLLTTLLATTKQRDERAETKKTPLIEVVGDALATSNDLHPDVGSAQNDITEAGNRNEGDDDNDESFDWELPQTLPVEQPLLASTSYGFANQYNGFFTHVQEMANEINVLTAPETSGLSSRRAERLAAEDTKFSPEHYAADFFGDEEIQEVLAYRSPWQKCLRELQKQLQQLTNPSDGSGMDNFAQSLTQQMDQLHLASATTDGQTGDKLPAPTASRTEAKDTPAPTLPKFIAQFTDQEKAQMQELPRKELLIDTAAATQRSLYLGLVDLLYAYSYNHRTTFGDSTVESAWTIGTLSPTLAALEEFTSLKDTVVALYRRTLAYPLYRHWELCDKVRQDTYMLLLLGRRGVLKALLELKDLFDHHDTYYVYSKLYLDDYCIWVQRYAREKVIQSLAQEVQRGAPTKADIGWDLDEIETMAYDDSASNETSQSETESEESDDDEEEGSDVTDSSADEASTAEPSLSEAKATLTGPVSHGLTSSPVVFFESKACPPTSTPAAIPGASPAVISDALLDTQCRSSTTSLDFVSTSQPEPAHSKPMVLLPSAPKATDKPLITTIADESSYDAPTERPKQV
ncbi:hypothetical protein H4R34_005308 [Dimargaris verticillata]|uniref:CS domain-containing protein n=1 Tax=Dimargaris verticillata TaxID=2761393 RepID=A0A9W8AWQ8_9FUNG|nr:hypothetical protein H4R34_005308 [Dimargaris verticillata]